MIKPIKGIEISEPFFMAPLAGITDRSFRTLCAEQGASMLYFIKKYILSLSIPTSLNEVKFFDATEMLFSNKV